MFKKNYFTFQKILELRYFKYLVLAIFILFAFYLLFYNLGTYPLENWDEAWYGQITREMLSTHNFIVLHHNNMVWLDKPPLQFWINGIFSLFLGLNAFSVRLISALSALILIILVSVYTYKRYYLLPSFLAFGTLILNNVFIYRARSGDLDLLASLLIFLSYIILISKNKYKYPLLGLDLALIYMQRASLVAFPLVILLFYEIIFNRKNFRKNLKEYGKLILIFVLTCGSWLFLGYLQDGKEFINYFVFTSDRGVAGIHSFNPIYISYVYYMLQRRFFYLLLIGFIFALKNIKRPEYFLLILYSCLLLIQLSFSYRSDNWYLAPSMPFWSILIAYGAYSLICLFKKIKYLQFTFVIILLIASSYIFYKTYKINITPILGPNYVIKQAQSAVVLNKLTNKNDIVVRLDFFFPTTAFYSQRTTISSPDGWPTWEDWLSRSDLMTEIKQNKIKWFVGKNSDVVQFEKELGSIKYKTIKVNDEESIVKVL